MTAQRALLEQKITRILANISAKAEDMISAPLKLEDLGIESLDVVEIAIEMEAEFGIPISDDDIIKLVTVGDIFDLIENQKRPN